MIIGLTVVTGSCDRSVDTQSVCCTRISTNLGGSPLVLGLYVKWAPRWVYTSLVDCVDTFSSIVYELPLRLCHALWPTRYVLHLYCKRKCLCETCNLEYYHQTPPKVPHFLKTLFRRKLVLWFLASEILRDYWLSGVREEMLSTCLTI